MMACQLNGANQNLVTGTSFSALSSDFSISVIARINALNGAGAASYITDFRGPSGFTFGIINSSNQAKLYGYGGGPEAVGSSTLALGTRYHIMYARSGTSVRYYLNGIDDGGFSSSFSQPPGNFVIGARYTQITEFFNGTLSELAIWNTALSAAEASLLAQGFTADQIKPQSLQFYAPFVREFIDIRGNSGINNINGVTVSTHPRIIA